MCTHTQILLTVTNISPYFQNIQNKTILEIAQELNKLQEKGLNGQLGLNDLSGGTFTISNIGIVSLKPRVKCVKYANIIMTDIKKILRYLLKTTRM